MMRRRWGLIAGPAFPLIAMLASPIALRAQDSDVVIIDDTVEEVVVVDEGGVDVLQIPLWMYERIDNWWQNLPDFPGWPPSYGPSGDDPPEEDADCEGLTEQLREKLGSYKLGVGIMEDMTQPGAGFNISFYGPRDRTIQSYRRGDAAYEQVLDDVTERTHRIEDEVNELLDALRAGGCMGESGS